MSRASLSALAGLLAAAFASTAAAQSQTAIADASVDVSNESVRFDPQRRPTALDFGRVIRGGSAIVDPGGEGPPSAGAAQFFVIGPPFTDYSIVFKEGEGLAIEAENTPVAFVSGFNASSNLPRVGSDGTDTFFVGAQVEVDSAASLGTYSATYTVTLANP